MSDTWTTIGKASKRAFVALLATVLQKRSAQPRNLSCDSLREVLFLRQDKIGDMAISLPTIAALKAHAPDAKITFLASPRNHTLISEDWRVNDVVLYRKRILSDIATVIRLRSRHFDVVFDLVRGDSVTSLVLSQLIAPRGMRVGIHKTRHAQYYDYTTKPEDVTSGHIIDVTAGCLRAVGIDVHPPLPPAPALVSHIREENVAKVLLELVDKRDVRWIGINISAGKPSRLWASIKYAELIRTLMSNHPQFEFLLLYAPGERPRAEEVVALSGAPVHLIPEGMSILDIAAVTGRLQLLITPDTSLVHIARGHNVPVVGLYSNATWNSDFWAPYGQSNGIVSSQSPDNIFDIEPAAVIRACDKALHSGVATHV